MLPYGNILIYLFIAYIFVLDVIVFIIYILWAVWVNTGLYYVYCSFKGAVFNVYKCSISVIHKVFMIEFYNVAMIYNSMQKFYNS